MKNRYDWILRIDADEYFQNLNLLSKIIRKIRSGYYSEINGLTLNRKIKFLGKFINYGGLFPIKVTRLFRAKNGLCENRWMDEHIIVDGKIVHEDIMIIDDNKKGL